MNIYKEMYYKLFNRVTDAIEELKAAQLEAEEMFLSDPDGEDENGDADGDGNG